MARRYKSSKGKGKSKKPKARGRPRGKRNSKPLKLAAFQPRCCLSPVAQAYAEALTHPDTGPLVGVPNGDTLFSKKLRVWCRGSATPDATHANVHIIAQPFAALAKDLNVVAVVANGSALPSNLATGGQVTNAPYVASDFSATGIQGRLVSAVLRCRFVGTNLNAGGLEYGIQEPTHNSIAGWTETNILATTCGVSRSIRSGEDWLEVKYRPIDHNDTSWITSITRTSASAYDINSDYTTVTKGDYPFMGVMALCAANTQTIQWEFWATVEYAGPTVTGKTITPPDVQGWASVIAAHSQFDEMHSTITNRKQSAESSYVSSAIKQYAEGLLNAAAPYVKQGAVAAGTAILNRYLRPRPVMPMITEL